MLEIIHKIPILTTLLSIFFFFRIYKHWKSKPEALHIFWWMLGVFFYGMGTLVESYVGLFGWNEWIFKSWYIFGALLGGAPLAQGTVYLFLKRRTAHILSAILIVVVVITSVVIILSPIDYSLVESTRLTGKVLVWFEIRYVTPFINIYAFIFLVGGAAYSAWKYFKNHEYRSRFIGNVFIAVGGLLPGIGGSFTKFGHTEVLYVTELLGLLSIFYGYIVIRRNAQ